MLILILIFLSMVHEYAYFLYEYIWKRVYWRWKLKVSSDKTTRRYISVGFVENMLFHYYVHESTCFYNQTMYSYTAICLAKVPPEATVFLALRPVPVSASLWIYYRYFCNICGSRTDFFHNASLSVLYTMCYLSIRTRIIIIIMFIKQSWQNAATIT